LLSSACTDKSHASPSTADPSAVVQTLPPGTATVTGALTAGPTIAIRPGAVIPTTKQTFLVARGHGASVRNGTAVVQYQGVNWVGQVQGSTWANGTPTSVPIGDAATATGGLFDSIAGLPINSRVLIEAPGTPGPDRLTTSVAVVVDIIAQVTTAKAMAV
jgi:peptidylprolyl isomerase